MKKSKIIITLLSSLVINDVHLCKAAVPWDGVDVRNQLEFSTNIKELLKLSDLDKANVGLKKISDDLSNQIKVEREIPSDLEIAKNEAKGFYEGMFKNEGNPIEQRLREAAVRIIDHLELIEGSEESSVFGNSEAGFVGVPKSPLYPDCTDSMVGHLLRGQRNLALVCEMSEALSKAKAHNAWISGLEQKYLGNPETVLDDFKILIDKQNFSVMTIVHETAHILDYYYGALNLKLNKKGLNNNGESVSIYFEAMYAFNSPSQKLFATLRLYQLCGHFPAFMEYKNENPNSCKQWNDDPVTFICQDEHIVATYNALKFIQSERFAILNGLEQAMYGEMPPLTQNQLYDLVDMLCSWRSYKEESSGWSCLLL